MLGNDPPKLSANKPRDVYFQGVAALEIVLLALVFLSVIGVGITDFSPKLSTYYWFAMIPTFAAGCLIIEWGHSRRKGTSNFSILGRQLLIWIGALLSISVVYVLLANGRLNYENTGLIILLLLAFATYAAGIIVDYRLCLLGVSLGLALLLISYLEEYIWLVLILGLGGVALTFRYLMRNRRM